MIRQIHLPPLLRLTHPRFRPIHPRLRPIHPRLRPTHPRLRPIISHGSKYHHNNSPWFFNRPVTVVSG